MKISGIAFTAIVTIALSSCSVLDKVRGHQSGTPRIETNVSAPAPGTQRTSAPAPPAIAGERPDATTLCGGRWHIVAVGNIEVENTDDMPYIDFEKGTGRFYASDGCNIINGDYLLRSDGTMVFSNVLTTMAYCPGNEWNTAISRRLADSAMLYVDTRKIGQETYIYLRTASGKTEMTLRRHNMEFLNGNWVVTSIEGNETGSDDLTLFFDIAELKVHGNTTCNYFNGSIYINPQMSNAIDFSDMTTSGNACPEAGVEARMVVALESTVTAIEGRRENTVLLLDAEGNETLILRRP